MAPFEADLDPETGSPRIRFTFANGKTASVILRMSHGRNGCDYSIACLALMQDRKVTEIVENEATPDEVAAFLTRVASI